MRQGGIGMNQVRRGVWAVGTILILLAGCARSEFAALLSLESETSGRGRVISGSLETVARSTQATLMEMGLASSLNRRNGTIRIAGKTASGTPFTVVLTQEQADGEAKTRVRLEWDGASDDQLGFQLLGQLETQSRK